jgi:energy-coupling factor transporter ATP-binding protein EcfA2
MLMLVTGSSGAGKSTVRKAVTPVLSPEVVCVELRHVEPAPTFLTLEGRQRAAESAVRLALELQAEGRHLLLSGDPVAAAEVIAAPSAPGLDGIGVCLLDVSPEAQAARLAARGDDPALLHRHQGFAKWMRQHARDPRKDLHVLTTGGWDEMRWDRLASPDLHWHVETIDTTDRPVSVVSAEVVDWCRSVLDGQVPRMSTAA